MYVLHIEMIEARVAVDRTGLIVAQAVSGKEVELPDANEARAKFDELLMDDTTAVAVDPKMANIRKALGV